MSSQSSGSAGPAGALLHELFAADVGFLLRTAKSAVQTAQARYAGGPAELTPAQFSVLFAVVRVPGATLGQVCELASLSPATSSVQLARLAREGKVVAVTGEQDRRRAFHHATAPAAREVERYLERLHAAEEAMLAVLDPPARDRLLTHLDRTAFSDRGRHAGTLDGTPEAASAVRETHAFGRLVRVGLQRYGSAWTARAGTHTPSAHALLRVVDARPDRPQREVGDGLAIDATSVAGLVSRLRRKGLLTVRTGPDDRRQRLLALTPQGRELLVRSEALRAEIEADHLRPLDAAATRDFLRLLVRVVLR